MVLWLKTAPSHVAVLWQVSQVCGKFDATWLGFVVPWKSFKWQVTQAVLFRV